MATMTVKDLATELGTDPRTARKFLRKVTDTDQHPGKGGRWEIERKNLRTLRKQFADFAAPEVPEDDEVEVEVNTDADAE